MSELRRKLTERGPHALTDAELWAVVMRCDEAKAACFVADGTTPAALAVKELGRRAYGNDPRLEIDGAKAAAGAFGDKRSARKEHFLVLCVDARRRLIHRETVSIGTLSASLVHPREVFGPAIEHRAAAIIAMHNHPSGDTSPSAEDKDATRRLQRAGELLGIPMLDHVIVSESGFFSFKEHGLL